MKLGKSTIVPLSVMIMRVENKSYYYFEEKEKKSFNDFLLQSNTSMRDFAELCGVSITLLSLIVNGKRAITKDMITKFERNGFKLEL